MVKILCNLDAEHIIVLIECKIESKNKHVIVPLKVKKKNGLFYYSLIKI